MSERAAPASFRLASDRDYRRGVILGLTLAEVLLLLVFLLLLAAGALVARTQEDAARQAARVSELQSQLQPVIDALNRSGHSVTDADSLFAIIRRSQEADALRDQLKETRSALEAAEKNRLLLGEERKQLKAALDDRSREPDALRDQLKEMRSALEVAEKNRLLLGEERKQLKAASDDRSREADRLRSQLEGARMAVENLRQLLDQTRSELQAALAKTTDYDRMVGALKALPGGVGQHPDQDLMNRLGQYRQAMEELARLKGNGSGLPYCWVTSNGQPIYMLRFELHDGGFVVYEEQTRPRPDDPAWALLAKLARNASIPENELVTQTAPLVSDANRRQCRYAVDVLDRTQATNKQGYKHLNYLLDQVFARHEIGG